MDFKSRPTVKTPITNRFEEAPPRPVEAQRPVSPHVAAHQTNIWARIASMVFLLCLLVLVVSLLLILAFGKFDHRSDNFSVSQLVNTSVRQIVTEDGANGPTYYVGNLTYLGQDYLVLENAQRVVYSPADNSSKVEALNCISPNNGKKLVINQRAVLSWNNIDSADLLNSATADTSCSNSSAQQPKAESTTTGDNSAAATGSNSAEQPAQSSSDKTAANSAVPVTNEPINTVH